MSFEVSLITGVYSVLTLYMMLILLRWVSPWLQLDLDVPRLRWIPRLTDPLISRLRRLLPSLGPIDFGPVVALLVVWLVRAMSVNLLENIVLRK